MKKTQVLILFNMAYGSIYIELQIKQTSKSYLLKKQTKSKNHKYSKLKYKSKLYLNLKSSKDI